MTPRAFHAIVEARLRAQRRPAVVACAAASLVGFLQPHGVEGPLFFGSLLGIVVATFQGPGRHPHLDLCEQSAPLFGRELARAKALVPCVLAALATVAYCAGAAAGGGQGDVALRLAIALPAVIAATLTALSATIRYGPSRLLYVVLAVATSGAAYAIAVAGDSLAGELAFCALVAFLALRQYGEALARFDPV